MAADTFGVLGVVLGMGGGQAGHDAFEAAVAQSRLLGMTSLSTYQGFMHALANWTDPLFRRLWPLLHQRMEQIGGSFWCVGDWVPIALKKKGTLNKKGTGVIFGFADFR